MTGLAAQFGFAALGAGSLLASVQGVGDTLKAVNAAALEPTAANLEAAGEAMRKLGPDAQEFVERFQEFRSVLTDIRDAGAAGWFPGLTDALDEVERLAPRIEAIFGGIGAAGGQLAAQGAASLAGARWADFFQFLETEAPRALTELGDTVGNLAHGLAELWMAFTPLNQDVTGWLLNASVAFDEWADGLSQTEGFQEFVEYLRTNGPLVADALASISNAVIQIVEAAAPLGGPVLQYVTVFADALAAVADSDIGTPLFTAAAAMSAFSRATALANTSMGRFVTSTLTGRDALGQMYLRTGGLARMATAAGGLALAGSDVADGFELSNTASMAMMGTLAGPWGAAVGGAVGLTTDLARANDSLEEAVRRVDAAFESGTRAQQRTELRALRSEIEANKIEADGLGDAWRIVKNPLDALFPSVNALSGATREATDRYLHLRRSLRGGRGDIGSLLIGPLGLAEDALLDADAAMRKFTRSFARLNNLLTGRQTLIDYERALDDLLKTAKDNNFKPDFEKGRRGLERMNALVDTAITRSETLREQGDKLGAVRILRRAMGDLELFGKRSPEAKAAVADLIAELDRLNKKHAEPKVDADTKPAKEKLTAAERDLARWDNAQGEATATVDGQQALATLFHIRGSLDGLKSKTVFVNVLTRRSTQGAGTGYGPDGYAAGAFTDPAGATTWQLPEALLHPVDREEELVPA